MARIGTPPRLRQLSHLAWIGTADVNVRVAIDSLFPRSLAHGAGMKVHTTSAEPSGVSLLPFMWNLTTCDVGEPAYPLQQRYSHGGLQTDMSQVHPTLGLRYDAGQCCSISTSRASAYKQFAMYRVDDRCVLASGPQE